MCKNLPILNLPNEEDDLILETVASNKHWSAILKMQKKEKNSANIAERVLIKPNTIILQWKRKSLQLKGELKSFF